MEIFGILFLSIISLLFGMILMIIIQYFVLLRFVKETPGEESTKKDNSTTFSMPEALNKQLECLDSEFSNYGSISISLLMQFLFHELRYSDKVKNWIYKKLSMEFDELLTKTTTGKFFDSVTIRDIHMGSQFPDIKNIKVERVTLDENVGCINTLNLCLDLDYCGNFHLSVDGRMKFGKTAYLSIKVKQITGMARLQFTRLPYTHWSFSFYSDPFMDLAVESQFQGRQLQCNLTNLIMNQIKKAIKRKHVLPNYKIRYKPFFIKTDPGQLEVDDDEIVPQGWLEVTCVEISRLHMFQEYSSIYYTITLDSFPWISLTEEDSCCYLSMDILVTKQRQHQLGVVFKQELLSDKTSPLYKVTVETVVSHSPASNAGLQRGDWITSLDSKPITNAGQIAKLVRSVSSPTFTIRVRRSVDSYTILPASIIDPVNKKTDSEETVADLPVEAGDRKLSRPERTPRFSNENMTKLAQTLGNFALRKRKTSNERTSSEGSSKSTPTASSPSTPQHSRYPVNRSFDDGPRSSQLDLDIGAFTACYKSAESAPSTVINFNESHSFGLSDKSKYLNVNVWGLNDKGKSVLLGYANIPVQHVLNKYCESMLGYYTNSYFFLPPDSVPANSHNLSGHSGFEPCFCYGDCLLNFVWENKEKPVTRRKLSTCSIDADFKKDLGLQIIEHDFIRTQFSRTTQCDFCSKKIWLKDAMQCRNCGMCCHKKCVVKCQTNTMCKSQKDKMEFSQPEITMTEPVDDDDDADVSHHLLNGFSGLKRVNSANSLAIPTNENGLSVGQANSTSRSLPHSPQHSPRKQSLVNVNPFALCPALLETCYQDPTSTATSDCILQILDMLLQFKQDEKLMDLAKESAKTLYSDMLQEERVIKINLMMTELKKTLDDVTLEHSDLSKKMSVEDSACEKAKLAFLAGQADAKMHALSALMLHYCSCLQQAQEKIV